VRDEETLFGWVRYYFGLIVVVVVLGVIVGVGYVQQALQRFESSVIIVEKSGRISSRHVGPIVSSVFGAAEVYEDAIDAVGLDLSSEDFYARHLDLLPVPDTNTVLVIARADELALAEDIAIAVSESLVATLNESRDDIEFTIFSGPQPAPSRRGVSTKVAGVLGAASGMWMGLALAILHYRWRRPVLTFRKALDITEAEHAAVVEGRWWRWFGFLRPGIKWKNTPGNRIRLARLLPSSAQSAIDVEVVGKSARHEASVSENLLTAVDAGRPRAESDGGGSSNGLSVVVVHAGTGERELTLVRRMLAQSGESANGSMALVWVR
jgi:hypothetical protein